MSAGTLIAVLLVGASAMYLFVLHAFNTARRQIPVRWFACCCVMIIIYSVCMVLVTLPSATDAQVAFAASMGYSSAIVYIVAANRFEILRAGKDRYNHRLEALLLLNAVLGVIPGAVFDWDTIRAWHYWDTQYRIATMQPWALLCCGVIFCGMVELMRNAAAHNSKAILFGAICVCAAGCNDIAVSLGLYDFGYFAAAGALIFLLIGAVAESASWGDEAKQQGELKHSLERRVRERSNELEQAAARLEKTERLAALGRLAAAVGHEINNPLTYVTSNLEMLKHSELYKTDSRVEDALEGVGRIAGIVSQLRVLSKPASGSVETIDVKESLRLAVKTLTPGLTDHQQLTFYSDTSAYVTGNHDRLVQLFINLLSNSLESYDDDLPKQEVIVTLAVNDSQVIIHIDYSGSGIPEHIRNNLFEPFVTGKYNGMGLGLAISKTILDDMHGSIDIQDRQPRGTRVSLSFKLVAQPEFSERSLIASKPASKIRSQRILVVDDEPLIRNTLEGLLSDYEVIASTSAEEAKGLITQQNFDLVICDMVMPRVSGIDLLNFAARKDPHYPERLVLMSGGVPDPDVADELRTRQVRFLSKPFRFAELTDVVGELASVN